jgi:hypothetical protein
VGVLLDVLLFVVESAVCQFIIKGLELSGFDAVALILEEGGHLDFLLGFLQLAAVVGDHLLVEVLLALVEGLLVKLAVLLRLLEFESGHAHLQHCVRCIR